MNKKRIPLPNLFYFFSIGILFFTALSVIPVNSYFFDLISHFKLQYMLGSLFFGLISLYFKRLYLTILLAFSLVANSFFVFPWYVVSTSTVNLNKINSNKSIKLYHANILSSNKYYQQLFNQIVQEEPDVLLLQEVSTRWKRELEGLSDIYPYSKIVARPDNFGIAILSKLPINDLAVKDWGKVGLPSLLARFNVSDNEFILAYTHPLPPVNSEYFRLRNLQLAEMVKELKSLDAPLIIAGDFNLTMWSTSYQVFSPLNLTNTRYGHGLLSTWPSALNDFGIPIDHILVSEEFKNIDSYSINLKGSDHRPIISDVIFSPSIKSSNRD